MDKIPAVGKTKLQLQQCMTTTGDVGSERWAARYLQLSRNLGTYFFDNYGRKFMAAAHAYPEIFTILGIVTQAVTENVKEVMIPEYCVGQRTLDEWNEGCPIRSPGTPVANHIIKQVTKVIEECSNLEHERYEFFNYWDDWKIPNLQEYYKNGTLALIEEMMVHSPWCSEDTVHIKTDIARVVEIEPYKVRNKSIKRTIDGEYKNNTITKQLFNSTGRRTENTGNTDWTCDETIESYEEDELCQEETYRGKLWWWWRRKENKDENWKLFLPDGINIDIAFKDGLLKVIPRAVVMTILSPKVLLGLMVILKSLGSAIWIVTGKQFPIFVF